MGAFTDFTETAIINHFLRNTAYTAAASVYVALYNELPTEAGAHTDETNYTGYLRQISTWSAYNAGTTSNVGNLEFPANNNPGPGSASVTIKGAAIVDHATRQQGNMLMYGPLSNQKTLAVGDVLAFAPGALILTVD